ncbi:MAG: cytochrome c peroxidase [Planctomycetota bacterium]
MAHQGQRGISENRSLSGAAAAASLAALALALGACGNGIGGGSGGSGTASPASVAELRNEIAAEGITAAATPPTVADELFALGRALYFDKLLSGNMDVSCATCHWPEDGTSDGRALPGGVGGTGLGAARVGGAVVARHSPTVLNSHEFATMFWDGRVERLAGGGVRTPAGSAVTAAMLAVIDDEWEFLALQALFPPTSRDEMRGAVGENELANFADSDFTGIWNGVRDRVIAYPGYSDLLLAAYPGLSSLSDVTIAHLVNAIAAFETRAYARTDSPWERFVAGDDGALTQVQVDGALEFFGPGDCARCHSGAAFTDLRFHNIGLPQIGPGKGNGASGTEDFGRENVTGNSSHRYRFRTPSLLNITETGPYGHAGQYGSLESIVDHYRDPAARIFSYDIGREVADTALVATLVNNQTAVIADLDGGLANPRRFDVDDVVAFLGALTADSAREAELAATIPTSVPSGLAVR